MFFIVYDVWWVNWILWSCLIDEQERCYGCAKFFLSNVHFIKSMQHRPEASQWQGQRWELHQTSEFTEPKGITKHTRIYAGFLSCIWKSGICSWLKRNPPSFGYWKKKTWAMSDFTFSSLTVKIWNESFLCLSCSFSILYHSEFLLLFRVLVVCLFCFLFFSFKTKSHFVAQAGPNCLVIFWAVNKSYQKYA